MTKRELCEACRSCIPEHGCGGCLILFSERPKRSLKLVNPMDAVEVIYELDEV